MLEIVVQNKEGIEEDHFTIDPLADWDETMERIIGECAAGCILFIRAANYKHD